MLIFYRHRRSNDLRQLFGAGHRFNTVTFDDRAGDTFTETLFAEGFNHPGDIGFFCRLQPLGRGLTARRIHAHVQRPVAHKGKAAFRIVKLRGRDAEIEQNAVDLTGKITLVDVVSEL